jgi:hypothetical protein
MTKTELEAAVAWAEEVLQKAKRELWLVQKEQDIEEALACKHDWKWVGEGRHGSDKGDDYYDCRLCRAKRREDEIKIHGQPIVSETVQRLQ